MTKHIDLVFTAPPTIDAPQFVAAVDDSFIPIEGAGRWIEPDAACPYWRYRIVPSELLLMVMNEMQDMQKLASVRASVASVTGAQQQQALAAAAGTRSTSTAQDARAAMKARLAGKTLKQNAQPAAAPAPINPDLPEEAVDVDEELATAVVADPDDGGFDPSAAPDDFRGPKELAGGASAAINSRLFDGVFHGKGGDSGPEESDD